MCIFICFCRGAIPYRKCLSIGLGSLEACDGYTCRGLSLVFIGSEEAKPRTAIGGCFYFAGRLLPAHHPQDWLKASRSRYRTRKVLKKDEA
jgi:hypothetical protein